MAARELVEVLGAGLTRHWRVDAVRYEVRTPFQQVLIAETAHGTTLFCDDERQSAESTQLVYHEALFLPPALLAARRERVLVVGSSEGVVSQLAVAVGARVVDHVDIDPDCVRACAEHLPYGYTPEELAAAERHDGPVRVHYGDGLAFVADAVTSRTAGRYDVVVVDLPDERPDDPESQLNRLYSAAFLRRCADLLTEGGVVVSQAGSPARWRNATLRAALDRFREVFAQVVPYVSDEHEWAFLTGRRVAGPDPVGEMTQRLGALGHRPATLDAEALRARSVLPFDLRSED
jgi:spermidine synthase